MSQEQFKPMAIILILTVPIFFWLLYRLNELQTTITMPYLGTHNLHEAVIWVIPAWMLWYMICSITLSQVIRKSLVSRPLFKNFWSSATTSGMQPVFSPASSRLA